MDWIARASPRQLARIAGALYLAVIVAGLFAFGYVPATIFVSGDAAATAHNIVAHEQLYRWGLVAHMVVLPFNIPLAVIFYELFKVVNRRLALLDAFLILVGTAVEGANQLNQFAPLTLLGGGPYSSSLTGQQLQVLAYMPLDSASIGYDIQQVFYGLDILAAAYLVYMSTFMPRPVGVLLAIAGLSYLFYSFADFLSPAFAGHLVPYIQFPGGIGELSLSLWLLIAGVNGKRWQERAGTTGEVATVAGHVPMRPN